MIHKENVSVFKKKGKKKKKRGANFGANKSALLHKEGVLEPENPRRGVFFQFHTIER